MRLVFRMNHRRPTPGRWFDRGLTAGRRGRRWRWWGKEGGRGCDQTQRGDKTAQEEPPTDVIISATNSTAGPRQGREVGEVAGTADQPNGEAEAASL